MKTINNIPSIPELAVQYGTITKEQFDQVIKLYNQKQRQGIDPDYGDIILQLKIATSYQVGLLKLIQEYLILKKSGEEFGKIAIKKGYATPADVKNALEHQKREFKKAKRKKLIGDILVEGRVITTKQKNTILKEQSLLEKQTDKILGKDKITKEKTKQKNTQSSKDISITNYEKQFLKIKVLDKEFAAIVLEKGFSSKQQVYEAQTIQEEEFEKERRLRTLGDIMVSLKFISEGQKNLILEEQSHLNQKNSSDVTPNINVLVNKDRTEAKIQVKKIDTICLDDIKNELKTHKIKSGVFPDPVLQCNIDMKNSEFIIARQGVPCELQQNSKAKYYFDIKNPNQESFNMGSAIAQQEFDPDSYVKKDLFGKDIKHSRGNDMTFRCGFGTRLSKDKTKAVAGKSGFPSLSIERKLFIHPVVNVLEDADLKYGALENYGHLKILGILTGAYPIKAGSILAREIRGANITAIGNVKSQIGITESFIDAQGDIHARYIHGSVILCFGDIYVDHEIIDSKIFCSGKIKSGKCRIISTDLYAKKGIDLAGAGNNRTRPCILAAGTEHHLLEKEKLINLEIKAIYSQLEELKDQIINQELLSKKTFQKMVELKIFHDRAKKKKKAITIEFNKRKKSLSKEKLKNIVSLVNNFQERMDSSIKSLKKLNAEKKKSDSKKNMFEKKYQSLEKRIHKETREHKTDLKMFFEWAKGQENIPRIKINYGVSAGTIFKGIYSGLEAKEDTNKSFTIYEKKSSGNNYQMAIQKT